ncbi:tetratricopeptide repeat protein [Pseudonocardia kunmingensis]|uniref:Cytochrome c-type biogenesis protein CcmH/NrfG n=1 Tax=Pseudonocardia kunmingensis TaxID=630975 RepID=A0A543DKN3_9PSEU|nr:tetratricopeptide repeat protein [Pseudonocardia kunmingensis]TQM09881.1 cytochrome c-type biogenesis protein CcmH/NrfG [Pseudonocardia kunmingensis]
MTGRQAQLRQLADQAVRDIVELEAQVAAGEITEAGARPLRHRYETTAGRALQAVDALGPEGDAAAETRPRPRGWTLAYVMAGVVALMAAVVLLPTSVLQRPAGGFVTGNEAVQGVAPPLDPSAAVTDEQLEQVVDANPEVVGMRLALADRYAGQGEYDRAVRHYLEALRREPRNVEGLAGLSWLLLQVGQPQEALTAANEALSIDPAHIRALWSKANIQLHGVDDPTGARATLQELARRDLTPEDRTQVDQLSTVAEQRAGGSG